MNVSFAPTAANDLASIRIYLDETGSLHAVAVIARLLDACDRLALLPDRGFPWKLSSGRIVRRLTVDRHFIFYEVENKHVKILRIMHAHRDLRDIFRLDEPDED